MAAKQVSAIIRLVVNAGQAKPAPPVGPALGQHRLNLMAFCKDFNARTQGIKAEVPMSVMVTAYKDNSFEFVVKSPSTSYFLKKAAGLQAGGGNPGHKVAGYVTPKHIYEIAKIKQADPDCQYMPLESICKSIMGTARSMGIEVRVISLDRLDIELLIAGQASGMVLPLQQFQGNGPRLGSNTSSSFGCKLK